MTNILWISRHTMTDGQLLGLKKIYGDDIRVTQFADTVKDISQLDDAAAESDVVAAVLPLTMMAEFLRRFPQKPLIQSVCERQPTGATVINAQGTAEQEFGFVHRYWQQVEALQLVTRRLE